MGGDKVVEIRYLSNTSLCLYYRPVEYQTCMRHHCKCLAVCTLLRYHIFYCVCLVMCMHVHICRLSWAKVTVPSDLLSRLLPGPVTTVFERTPELNPTLNPGVPLVGLRIPEHAFVQQLVARCGSPIALTSANISQSRSTLSVEVREFIVWLAMVVQCSPSNQDISHQAVKEEVVAFHGLKWCPHHKGVIRNWRFHCPCMISTFRKMFITTLPPSCVVLHVFICHQEFRELWPSLDLVIDGGAICHGGEGGGSRQGSTVVDLSQRGKFSIIRPGM